MPDQSLIPILRDHPESLAGKSIRQIVSFTGDGKLRDGNNTSQELRLYLAEIDNVTLKSYAQECLTESFQDSGLVLQDIMNEVGTRLGFHTTPGRYRGVRGEIGHDGLWKSRDGHCLIIELKTTDAYRIDLDTVANYRQRLIEDASCKEDLSSILLVVGRIDTGGIEAQIRGSKHAWDIRVIGVDALLRLLDVKDNLDDWATSSRINLLLRPFEYTRVDEIVELLFFTARDVEVKSDVTSSTGEVAATSERDSQNTEVEQPRYDHKAAKATALGIAAQQLGVKLVKKGGAFWASSDDTTRIVCLSSQAYEDSNADAAFWYGFTPGQKNFFDDSVNGYVLFACADLAPVLIPWQAFSDIVANLKTTPPSVTNEEDIRHWHVTIYHHSETATMSVPLRGGREDVSQFVVTVT